MSSSLPVRTVAVIGGGPAGLIAAETLARAGVAVIVHEKMPTFGRKLLMAGRGGLNLTHSEDLPAFKARYAAAEPRLEPLIDAFPPDALRAWSRDLGQETFVGSSGRVFPKAMKASPLLRAWLRRLESLGVELRTRSEWRGWADDGALRFIEPDGERIERPDAVILALGGASWAKLGSDGGWTDRLAAYGVALAPFRPANSGFLVAWTDLFRERFAGQPIKSAAFSTGGRTVRGDAVIAGYGLEGGAIYALSADLRDAIQAGGAVTLTIDLRPDLTRQALTGRLHKGGKGLSAANLLRKAARLSPLETNLLREGHGVALPAEPGALAEAIKAVSLTLTACAPIDRAISTAGGVAWDGVAEDLSLKAVPDVFVAGEMLDWEAPTGGYLLQACFATGIAAARGVLARFRI
ncbi:TIGR03862 family flavoprotein [Caulobacter mirabilis]|uniref:Aminoacetone oxidase family FAD-binding enzyme n=1 Tax=Caulobacter mirabilis TaxID=69666 RepID=A0A2D2ASL9_9CAUL|nr:TIGR03862 family flavoprotein [Caulobacter mirabilis]ATQ40999.1 aminoacetone oxidase family FAD-binding enzyme [Caulobacter mirabilis]